MYSNYLESVVASEPETYKDIRGLMERCQVIKRFEILHTRLPQALVATRDGLRDLLQKTTVATEEEARSLEKFKEQKMGQTLDYNVRWPSRSTS